MLDKMIQEFNTYKHYDDDELREELNKILEACELGSLGNDAIESIDYYNDGRLYIKTSYSVRCCAMSDDYEIPAEVMEAEDKILAGREYAKNKKIKDLQLEAEKIKGTYIQLKNRELAIEAQLKELYEQK